MPPELVSHNLTDGAPRNLEMILQFSEPLLESTVRPGNVILSAMGARGVTEKIEVTYTEGQIRIRPEMVLEAKTGYRIIVTTDVLAEDDTPLASPVSISWTTGESIKPGPSSDLIDDRWREALGTRPTTRLVSTYPVKDSWGLNTNPEVGPLITNISLSFSFPLYQPQWQHDTWEELPISISVTPIDGDPRRPTPVPQIGSVTFADQGQTVIINLLPAPGVYYNTGKSSSWTTDEREGNITFAPNNLIKIITDADIMSADATRLFGERSIITLSTELFPKV